MKNAKILTALAIAGTVSGSGWFAVGCSDGNAVHDSVRHYCETLRESASRLNVISYEESESLNAKLSDGFAADSTALNPEDRVELKNALKAMAESLLNVRFAGNALYADKLRSGIAAVGARIDSVVDNSATLAQVVSGMNNE